MSDAALKREYPVGAIDTRATGWWAMVFTVLTEGALFCYLLFTYYYLWASPQPAGSFPPDGPPSMALSLPNTIVLILSSVAVGWAQLNIKRNDKRRLMLGLGVGAVLGMIFLVVQYFEWSAQKFTLSSNLYGSLFFTITGFHMAHVAAGVIGLWSLFVCSWLGYFNRVRYAHIHIGALYWHFVDVVWIFIFFTFYITPRL